MTAEPTGRDRDYRVAVRIELEAHRMYWITARSQDSATRIALERARREFQGISTSMLQIESKSADFIPEEAK